MSRRGARQLTLDDVPRKGRGGPRPRAGRKPGRRPRVLHRAREAVPNGCPVHVSLRVRREVPSLRTRRFVAAFRRSLRRGCERGEFRVVHYSIQRDHAHFLVEASGRHALSRGMKSLAARFARAANRTFGRSGTVLDGRYHARVLKTPREVRNALAYVLLNVRRHWKGRRGVAPPVRLDEASSGQWFGGWRKPVHGVRGPPAGRVREVAHPRSWLLTEGWRRWGLVDPAEVPGR